MTQDKQPGSGGEYPSTTQVPSSSYQNPISEPWDPRREPNGAKMPWEEQQPDPTATPVEDEMAPPSGQDQSPEQKR